MTMLRPSGSAPEVAQNTAIVHARNVFVSDSVESIEQDYVIVHAHFASLETLSSSMEASLRENSTAKFFSYTQKSIGISTASLMQSAELVTSAVESVGSQMSTFSSVSQASTASEDVTGPSSLNPSSRLKILYHYVYILTKLAQEKLNAGLHLVSFSVELVALAVWKEALRICYLWMSSTAVAAPGHSFSSSQKDERLPHNLSTGLDFSRPLSVCAWVERGFILACDRAEKISNSFRDVDGNMEMPDAMEIIFQTALSTGNSGAEDELMGQRNRAATSYFKAITLLTFILMEASSLPLSPPFFLSSDDRQRLLRYIINLRSHLNKSQMVEQHVKPHKAL